MALSNDPEARKRQLANLKRGDAGTPPGELSNRLRHGARSTLLFKDVEAEVVELTEAIAEIVPVRNPDGSVPAADMLAIEYAARALKRYRHLDAWVAIHGKADEKTGKVKPVAIYALQAEEAWRKAQDALGLTPASRAKLDLALTQTAATAEELEASRTARERLDHRADTIDAEEVDE